MRFRVTTKADLNVSTQTETKWMKICEKYSNQINRLNVFILVVRSILGVDKVDVLNDVVFRGEFNGGALQSYSPVRVMSTQTMRSMAGKSFYVIQGNFMFLRKVLRLNWRVFKCEKKSFRSWVDFEQLSCS